jgi:tetratricopeptide (TPR) repeat protein
VVAESDRAIDQARIISVDEQNTQLKAAVSVCRCQRGLWLRDAETAKSSSGHAWDLAYDTRSEEDFIRAARLQGEASLAQGELVVADERLRHALVRARTIGLVEEELPALVGMAELSRRRGDLSGARALLDDVWEAAERGPLRLPHADACNVLAQIERDAGGANAAVEAAMNAYQLAWCDGPPFAYYWGLEGAKTHLGALGAAEPSLLPYDESAHEPIPDVKIDLGAVVSKRISVFFSYSHKDKKLLERLLPHLSPLGRGGHIQGWTDDMIAPGTVWSEQIDRALGSAQLVLLLITADFIASDYCYREEMMKALGRHEAGTARVIPIILRPVAWQNTPFAKLQALPSGGKPVTKWSNFDDACVNIEQGIAKVVEELSSRA